MVISQDAIVLRNITDQPLGSNLKREREKLFLFNYINDKEQLYLIKQMYMQKRCFHDMNARLVSFDPKRKHTIKILRCDGNCLPSP